MKKIFTVLLIVFAINLFCVDPGTSPALTYKRILFLESNSLTDTYKKLYDGGGLNLEGFEVPFKLKLTGMMFNDANELIFRESGSRINSYGVGLLNLLADSEIDLITLTLDINASSGVDISNDLVINGTTASTSYTTGSVIIDGGVGIAKDVYINEDLNVQETTNLDNTNIVGAVNVDATTYDLDASTSVDIDASAGTIRIGYASEARPITIGNSTSETTIGDNLTVAGNTTTSSITLGGTLVTSTGAELNILDGVTADKDELNILNGVTATGAELNLLDAGSDEAVYDDASTVKVRVGGTTTFSFNTTALQPTGPGIDLGSSGAKFKDLYLDGDTDMGGTLDVTGATTTTHIQSAGAVNFDATIYDLDASTSLDIDAAAGVIQIGVNSEGRAVRIGNSTSETTIGENLTVAGTLTQTGASDFTGLVTADALTATGTSTLSTVDINAGAIDGTTIGATDAATGAFTTLTTSEAYTAGSTVDLNGNELILDLDGDTSITADVDDRIDFKVGGTDELVLNASRLSPYTDGGLDLGKQGGEEFGSIFLAEDVDCEGDLVVGDDASIGGDATIDGALTVGKMSTIQAFNYAVSLAESDAYTATLTPAITVYTAGMMIILKVGVNNTTACTLALNGLDPITILTVSGVAPSSLDLLTTGISILVYNGTNFILINPATTCD